MILYCFRHLFLWLCNLGSFLLMAHLLLQSTTTVLATYKQAFKYFGVNLHNDSTNVLFYDVGLANNGNGLIVGRKQ